MEKNPMESPIISKCLEPECQKLYKCTGEDGSCKEAENGEDGKCVHYEKCSADEKTRLSHGYCGETCVGKYLERSGIKNKKE